MSSGAVSVPLPSTVEPLGFLDLLGAVRKFLARALMSDRDRRLVDAVRQVTEEIGPPLLESRDKAEFLERLDAALESRALSMLSTQMVDRLVGEPDTIAPTQPSYPWPPELFGGAASRLDAADRRILEIAEAQKRLASSLPDDARQRVIRQAKTIVEHPLGFLEDPTLHPTLKEMMLDADRAEACFMAAVHALMANRRPEPWLSMALADIILHGSYQRLRLLASIPAAAVPVEVVPPADRLDMELIEGEAQETEAWLRDFAAGAGADDVLPFARTDD